ncbi:MAG TPA: MotA/TolQ/ExbB proton channel family protein [Burkholderiales bacterium]|nr:MotA/TolQ/ExbB proton channel family protein [Burkholderiales bacterium]
MTRMLAQEEKAPPTASAAAAGRPDHCAAPPRVHLANLDSHISAMPAQIDAGRTSRSAWEPVAWLLEKARPQSRDPHRYLLVLRFALLNVVGFALLAVAYAQGLVDRVIVADPTYLCVLIFLVFLGGLGICARKVWQTSRELNSLRECDAAGEPAAMPHLAPLLGRTAESRANLAGATRLRLSHRIAIVRNIGNTLVLLGLIGTVLGFIVALSGVDPERAADISAITPMVATLISGMSTALYTTLVGAVLNVWLMANHQLLASGTVKLIAALVERAEDHARG